MATHNFFRGTPDEAIISKKSARKYFYLEGNLYRQIRLDRPHEILYAFSYKENKEVELPLAYVKKKRRPTYTVTQVAVMLNRSRMRINHLFMPSRQEVFPPQRSYDITTGDRKRGKYRFSEEDVYRLHEFFATSMHYKKYTRGLGALPTKTELRMMMKYEKIPYVKTKEGNFVPTWDAPDTEDW